MKKDNSLPLEGIKVVDFSTFVAAPTAARFMADWGAEVAKIESLKGDDYRSWGEIYRASISDDENPVFAVPNINKKMVALNVKTPEGLEIIKKIIAEADIFITNVRMDSLKKIGLTYEDVKIIKPDIIYGFLSGFGINGADATRPGLDAAAFFTRGAAGDWRDPEDFPARPPVAFGDMVTAGWFLSGLLTALCAKQRTGKGTFITTSLYSTSLWCGSSAVVYAQEPYGNPVQRPNGKNQPNSPFMTHYRCKDGEWIWIGLQNYNAGGYEKVCRALGLEELVEDERYSTLKEVKKPENLNVFLAIVREKFMSKTADEWSKILIEKDIIHEKHRHYRDITKDPQAWENGYFSNVNFPSGTNLAMANPPVAFSEYNISKIEVPTAIGRDTEEFLIRFGYSPAEVERLRKTGIVK